MGGRRGGGQGRGGMAGVLACWEGGDGGGVVVVVMMMIGDSGISSG